MRRTLLRQTLGVDELIDQTPDIRPPRPVLRTTADISGHIDLQSADRMYPYTSRAPFGYAEVTQDDGWTWDRVLILGNKRTLPGVPLYQFKKEDTEPGFMAFKEVVLKPGDPHEYSAKNPNQREANPSLIITQSWLEQPNHGIRGVLVETAKRRTFAWGAPQDYTLLDTRDLREGLPFITNAAPLPSDLSDVARTTGLIKALIYRGDVNYAGFGVDKLHNAHLGTPKDFHDMIAIRNLRESLTVR